MTAAAVQAQTAEGPMAQALLPPFPATWKASLSHWWSHNSATDGIAAQNALVRRGLEGTGIPLQDYSESSASSPSPTNSPSSASSAPSVPSATPAETATLASAAPSAGKVAKLRKVALGGGKDRFLNVLEVGEPVRRPGEQTFIVIHGYGGAFAFYWQNMATLCGFPNTRVYFMDMLGMGLSGRPKFPTIKVKGDPHAAETVQSRVSQAESFFLDSFEDFAKKEKLDKFTLIGHSLGGYLSTSYAIQNPHRVNKLVLVSPVGIPRSPYGSYEDEVAQASQHPKAGLEREFSEDQLETSTTTSTKAIGSKDSAVNKGEKETTQTKYEPKVKAPSGWWTHLWEANVSPFSIVRFSSFAGPKLVSRYASRRFAAFDPETQGDLFKYLYNIYGLKGSGEYCLAHILAPMAYARWPLIDRFNKLSPNIPVSFIYGENDWMDVKGGYDALKVIQNKADASPLQKQRSKVTINPRAGHWVFLDNALGMDKIFKREMEEALQDHKA